MIVWCVISPSKQSFHNNRHGWVVLESSNTNPRYTRAIVHSVITLPSEQPGFDPKQNLLPKGWAAALALQIYRKILPAFGHFIEGAVNSELATSEASRMTIAQL